MPYSRRGSRSPAYENQHEEYEQAAVLGISKTVGNAIIGLLVTLIGTGIIAMITLYVQVGTLTVSVRQTSDVLQAHLKDSVSEKQYQRDNGQIWAEIRQMVTQPQLDSIKQTLTDHGLVLRKIEDKLEQLPAAGRR